MSAEPNPVPSGKSSFDIAFRMFTRNRMAVVAASILLLTFYGAIWAPLLATSAPLYFRGQDTAAAAQAAQIARLEAEDLVEALRHGRGWRSGHVEASFATMNFQLERLEEHVGASLGEVARKCRSDLAGIRAEWADIAASGSPGDESSRRIAESLRSATADWAEDLVPAESDLETRTRWPAFRGLGFLDLALMLTSLSLPVAFLWWIRGRTSGRLPERALATAIVASVFLAVLLATLVPGRPDATDYKGGIRDGTIRAESAIFAPIPFGINESSIIRTLEAPMAGSGEHVLGTDELGRDTLCRMLWGARVSLSVGFVAVGIYVLIGVIIGAIAGFFGGWIDIVVSRFIEWIICFPVFFLILVIVAFLQDRTIFGADPPQLLVIMVVIGVTGWTSVARLVRAEFLRLVGQDFVLAARALGAGDLRIMFRQVLPNAMGPVLVAATFGVAGAILTESALSFLGLGISVPNPSWGAMLFAAHGYEQTSIWIFLWPGLAIFVVITCYNLVGEALRDAMDPRLRQ